MFNKSNILVVSVFLIAVDGKRREDWTKSDYALYTSCTVAGIVAVPGGIYLAGFTAGGVAAGSFASVIQSNIYGGATTGIFIMLQSAGVSGVGMTGGIIGGGLGELCMELFADYTEDTVNTEQTNKEN